MELNGLIIETNNHCTHGSLTSSYGWLVQIGLASAAFACLIVKRFCEPKDERRSWKIWFFDSARIGIGSILVHMINILTAEFFANETDPCTLYLISFILDTSIGLLILYLLVKFVLFIAIKFDMQTLQFGFYGSPTSKAIFWWHQTLAFIIILLVQKVIIYYILWFKAWDQVRDLILWLIGGNRNFEVALVLFIVPFFVNVFIFWTTDNFLTMGQRSRKMLDFSLSGKVVVKKLQNLKNCISNSAKLVNMYDIMFINTKQKLRNEEDDNLVEINLETINNQSV